MKNEKDGRFFSLLVAISSFLCSAIIFGIVYSYGTIYVALKNHYELEQIENAAMKASLIGSLLVGSIFLFSPIASILSDLFGIRRVAMFGACIATSGVFISSFITNDFVGLCLTFGIMFGTGSSLVYTPSVVIIGHYYTENNGLVSGFVTAASSLSTLVVPHVLKFLFDKIGIPATFRILSGIVAILIPASLTFIPTVDPNKELVSVETNNTIKGSCSKLINTNIWKNESYLVWIIALGFVLFGHYVPYVHIVAYTEAILPEQSGETLLTFIAISNIVGRLLFGKMADRPGVNPFRLQQFAFLSVGICTMLFTVAPYFGDFSYASLIVVSLLFGLFDASFAPLIQPTAAYIFEVEESNQAIGFMHGTVSIPVILGPFIAGILYEELKSYVAIFIFSGCSPIIGSIIICLAQFIRKTNEPSTT